MADTVFNAPLVNPALTADAAKRQALIAALPAPDVSTAPVMGTMPAPNLVPTALPNVGVSQRLTDQDELHRLQRTGSGVSQIQNPFLKGIARVADIASAFVAPRLSTMIPGTTLHHQQDLARQQGVVQQDQAQEQADADTQQKQALASQEAAKAAAYADPHKAVDPSKTVQTDDGVYQLNPDTGRYDQRVGGQIEKVKTPEQQAFEGALTRNGNDPVKAFAEINGAKNQKDATLQQQFLDGYRKAHPEASDTDAIAATIRATSTQPKIDIHQATERPESSGTWSMAFQGDKPVMYNTKTGEVKDAGGITKQAQVAGGPLTTADKNRASLAKIALNNLDQVDEIVTRRPDMFQKMGAVKSIADLTGSNDPDLVALGNEVHNFAMANAGIHGSRNFGNVQAAEQELLNHFKNGQAGIRGGIRANRDNLNAIINPNAPAPKVFTDSGTTYHIPADQVEAFKVAHPNAK